ncbi:MAG: ABC transporter permease [Crocinitomicaceae bacterium]|nr:ABC transporter permease [Crocinitomicaceae bacterium]
MILRLARKNIWRNRRRTTITIMAIGFAVMSAVMMRSVNAGMEEKMLESIVKNNMGYIQIHLNGFWDEQTLDNGFYTDNEMISEIEEIPNILSIDKKLEAGTLSSFGNFTRGTFIMSYDQTKEIPKKITNNIIEGSFPESGNSEILMGNELADYLGVNVGDTLVFFGQGYQGATAAGLYSVSGLIDMHMPELNRVIAYMCMEDLQYYLSAPDLVTALVIDLKDPEILEETKNEISQIVGEEYEVMTWKQMSPELEQLMLTSQSKNWIMHFILYMVITFVMFGTILMATQERRYELGVLLAIGMKKWKTMLMIVTETIIISLIGVLVGIGLAAPVAYYFHYNPIVLKGEQADMMSDMGFEPVIPFSIDPGIALDHAMIVLVISLVLVIYPIMIVKKLKPVEAMKL